MVDTAALDWDAEGAPRSRRFDDIYFSRGGGLDETRAVFLEGCGLPQAWRGRSRFTVAELGFGTGLNILALLDLWRRSREPGARLHVFSVEAFPLAPEDARRAFQAWPGLADLSQVLAAAWPTARGLHRIDFPALGAVLDLAILEVAEALEGWRGRADAWFLDGFAPAKNPEMWRDEVLGLVRRRSAPGAVAATFTVAGAVRRGLQAQGFEVARVPGFGAKGQRLTASLPEPPSPAAATAPRVCIVGAGIAGAALAQAFQAEGTRPVVIERAEPGAGASGNPAALVTPRFDAGGGPVARLHAQALRRAVDLYGRVPGAVIAEGALQLEAAARDGSRFDKLAASDLFGLGELERRPGALWMPGAVTVEPAAILSSWLGPGDVVPGEAAAIEPAGTGWRVLGADGGVLAEAEVVCIAGGFGSAAVEGSLRLQAVRGQVSFLATGERPPATAWGGYLVPTRDGLLFGATHDRDRTDTEVAADDHGRNLATLAQRRPELAEAIDPARLQGRAGVRAASPDRSPIAGELRPGLFVLTGLGGRGFTLAPLLAEHIAAVALDIPSPLPADLAHAVRPGRFG